MKDLSPGGIADNVPDSAFDLEQLKIGQEIELEHTDDPELAKEIAKDHLREHKDYYKKLQEMEKSFASLKIGESTISKVLPKLKVTNDSSKIGLVKIDGKIYTEERLNSMKTIKVKGDFRCGYNKLSSLKGAPEIVKGDFICYSTKLTSLQGAPISVGQDFDCSDNKLSSLKYSPKTVGGNFHCYDNNKEFTEDDVEAVAKVKGIIVLDKDIG